jgi:hypothetical protein
MKLGRLTPANTHKIRKPMWSGRKVGIATYKIGMHNLITIEAKNKDGLYIYSEDGKTPTTYYASGEQLNNAELMKLPTVTLRVIPIAELDPFEGRTE